jgi:mutual gliding-motility protein MglA
MVVYNYTGKEINAKVVYYGPALSGKTTNLEWIYSKIPVEYSGKMVSLRTQADRTIFFDFLPLDLGVVDGFRTRFMLYTVPGQVHYNATRKMVLKGVDGVVFVADSEPSRMQDNLESLQNLRENIEEMGIDPDSIPLVLQWNKRDLPNGMDATELEQQMNPEKLASFEACALTGEGVYETLHALCQLIYRKLSGGAEVSGSSNDGVSLFGETIAQCLQEIDERPSTPVPLALDTQAPAAQKTEVDEASVLAAILGGREENQAAAAVATAELTATDTAVLEEGETGTSFEFDPPDGPSATVDQGAPAPDITASLGHALEDALGQEPRVGESAAVDGVHSPSPESPPIDHEVDVIAELQSLSADEVSDAHPAVGESGMDTTAMADDGIDLDLILSEDENESSVDVTVADANDDLELIKDPLRLPNDASREAPSLGISPSSAPPTVPAARSRILEVPVALDADVFEDGKSLRIVLNITLRH